MAEFVDQREKLPRLLCEAQGRDLNAVGIPLSVAAWVRLPLGVSGYEQSMALEFGANGTTVNTTYTLST